MSKRRMVEQLGARFTVNLTRDEYARLVEIADANRISASWLAAHAVRWWLREPSLNLFEELRPQAEQVPSEHDGAGQR